jgi:imidazoleglycerol-phosphate dehydratase
VSAEETAVRSATIERKTKETEIRVRLVLDGDGEYEVDLQLRARGDLAVDTHHTVEDVGICLGQALREALGEVRSIRRFGSFVLPMAEAKVEVALDVSLRPYLVYRVDLPNDRIGGFDVSLVEDFLYAFSQNAGLDLHVELRYGRSPHHVVEAIFKGLARALRLAVEVDPRARGVPSVKGTL